MHFHHFISKLYFPTLVKRASENINLQMDSKYLKHFNLFLLVYLFCKFLTDFASEMNAFLCHLIMPFIRATNVPIAYYHSYILHQRYCHEKKILDIDISMYFSSFKDFTSCSLTLKGDFL